MNTGRGKKSKAQVSSSEEDNSDAGKDGIYRAPKMTSVAFDDKADKKAKQKEAYEKKKMGRVR